MKKTGKKPFWRKSGKEQAAKCPVCGKYMDKVNAIVIPSDSPIFTDRLHNSYCANIWICHKCNKTGKA